MVTNRKTATLKNIFKILKYMEGIKEVLPERNPMNILNVVKPLHVTLVFKGMKEFILERNLINVINVVKPL